MDAHTFTTERNNLLPALVLGMGAFLTQFDVTAMVVALPAIGAELRLDISGYAWVMDAYSLAFTGALLAAGAIADRFGRRQAVMSGNVLFMVASLICGVAPSGLLLYAARGLQGIGAAFVITGSISLLASTYPTPEQRARAFALMGVISGVAMAIGPTLGGLIAAWIGWRWIFFVNVPICLAVLLTVPRLVEETRDAGGRSLDWMGVTLLTLALGMMIESLLSGRNGTSRLLGGLAASGAIIAVFVWQQRRRTVPIFDPAIFMRPAMIGTGLLLLSISVGYWSVLVYLPMYLSAAFGWTGVAIGLAMLTATLPMLVLPPFGARLTMVWGWRWLFLVATTAVLLGNAVLAASASGALPSSLSCPCAFLGMGLMGLGVALAHPQLSGAVVALVPAEQSGMASAVTVVLRQGGFAIGIALIGSLMVLPEQPTSYVIPFGIAAAAAATGLLAAIGLLPSTPAK